jgi:hypothetical protein
MVGEIKMVSGAGASIKLSHELKTFISRVKYLHLILSIAVTPRPL